MEVFVRKNILAYISFAIICLVWGTTYLAIRIGVAHFPPFLFMALRQFTAGTILLGIAWGAGFLVWPGKRELFRQAIAGFLMIALGHGLLAWAETHIPSGLAAVISSFLPMIVILINLAIHKEERPNLPIGIGIVLGLGGIVMIFGEHVNDFGQVGYLLGMLMTFISTASWAVASIWLKKRPSPLNPVFNAGLQLFFGSLWLFPMSAILDNYSIMVWDGDVLYSLGYLILFGSVLSFWCYTYALKNLPVTIVSMFAYINPLVAVVLGWLVLDETLNFKIGTAIFITIGGIYIVNRGYQLRASWRAQVKQWLNS